MNLPGKISPKTQKREELASKFLQAYPLGIENSLILECIVPPVGTTVGLGP
jgi:hypothetical protein